MAEMTRAQLRKQADAHDKWGTYYKIAGGVAVGGGIAGVIFLGAPDPTEVGGTNLYANENAVLQYLYRARDAATSQADAVAITPNSLPPRVPPKENYINDFVLVLDMEKTLTYTEWAPEFGFRTMKRPGMDFFLDWAKQACGEVVIWSEKDIMDSQGLVQKIQEKNAFFLYQSHTLFKQDMTTVETEGEKDRRVKDISILNRDLAKVIVVDDDLLQTSSCKENALRITPWEGDPADTSLIDLISLLQAVINVNKDVRTIIPRYANVPDAGKAFVQQATARAPQQQQAQAQAPPSGAASEPITRD